MQGTRLKKVSMPKATHIGPLAFYNVSSLTLVELPSVRIIDRGAFEACNALTKVDLSKAVNLERIGDTKNTQQPPFPESKRLTILVPESKIGLFPIPETRKYKTKIYPH